MLKSVFGKKKDKRTSKSNSVDDPPSKPDDNGKIKIKKHGKWKRSKTNTSEMENNTSSKRKTKPAVSSKASDSSSASPSKRSGRLKQRSKTSPSTERDTNHKRQYEINDYVLLTTKRKGIVRYIGSVHFGAGEWYGIDLIDGSIGNHDGKVGKKRYFKTASKSAIFVTHDQIKKLLKKNPSSSKSSNQQPAMRSSNSTHTNRSNSSKRKKKSKSERTTSNSVKKQAQRSRPNRPERPNSAKLHGEFFPDHVVRQNKSKRSVPPPPPHQRSSNSQSAHGQLAAAEQKHQSLRQYTSSHTHTNSHSHSQSQSHSHSHSKHDGDIQHESNESLLSNISGPPPSPPAVIEQYTSMESIINLPMYQLQESNTTDLSAVDDRKSTSAEPTTERAPSAVNGSSVRALKQGRLQYHRSCNALPNIDGPSLVSNFAAIRKNKSYGDRLTGGSESHSYGLSLEEIIKDLHSNDKSNDPAIKKLKSLQNSMQETKQSSADLEQILSMNSPSALPPTPKLDLMPSPERMKSDSLSITRYFPQHTTASSPCTCHSNRSLHDHNETVMIAHVSHEDDDEDDESGDDMIISPIQSGHHRHRQHAQQRQHGDNDGNHPFAPKKSVYLGCIDDDTDAVICKASNFTFPISQSQSSPNTPIAHANF